MKASGRLRDIDTRKQQEGQNNEPESSRIHGCGDSIADGSGGDGVLSGRTAGGVMMLVAGDELAFKEPYLMRLVLQASAAALLNSQVMESVDAEVKRRAVAGN